MPKSGSQFNAIFFFTSDRKCRSSTFGRKPKTKGQHNFNAVSTENETVAVSFSFGENVRINKRKSMCRVGVQSSLDRFKKDWVIDVAGKSYDDES